MSAGLILIAAGLSRHLWTLTLLESSITSAHLADQLLIQEFLRRERSELRIPSEAVPGYTPSLQVEWVRLARPPLPDLELDRIIGLVSWQLRGQSRQSDLAVGVTRQPSAGGSGT